MKIFIKMIIFLSITVIKSSEFDTYEDLEKIFQTNLTCPICLDENDKSLFIETNCQNKIIHHTFHAKCFKKMAIDTKMDLCPLCRFDLAEIQANQIDKKFTVNPISTSFLIQTCVYGTLETLRRLLSYELDINCEEYSIKMFSKAAKSENSSSSRIPYILYLEKCTALITAAVFNRWDVVVCLLENEELDISLFQGYECLKAAILCQQLKVIRLMLIQNVIDLNKRDFMGNTFLTHAAKTDNIEIIRILLNYGADIDFTESTNGDTPYITAIKCKCSNATRYLFERGANIKKKNKHGKSSFDIAMELN